MASVTPISAPFMPISCLCARVSHFCNRLFRSWLLWQLMTMSITFDNGPDGSSIANSLSSGGSFLSKIGRKYFKITSPNIKRETLINSS